jgi:hypothetical protein
MSPAPRSSLSQRLAEKAQQLAEREAPQAAALGEARSRAEKLRAQVVEGLAAFHAAARSAGVPHLVLELGEIRTDDKHLRAVQFELSRGRYRAIVTVKSRGEVTLVGPFKAGKQEGPCRTFPWGAEAELQLALTEFLEGFAEEAATP